MTLPPVKNCANLFRRAGVVIAGLALVTSGIAFSFILNSKTGLPIKWPAGNMQYRIMLDATANSADAGAHTDGLSFNASAQAAIDIWNTRMGSLQIQGTPASGTPSDKNSVNELAFAANVYGKDFDTNVLAVTTGYSVGNERVETDTIFNKNKSWDSYRGGLQSKIDLRRVALHEIGHGLGLDHPDEATPTQNVAAIMNSHIGPLDTLADDDIQAIQQLYGPPGVPANNNFANATVIAGFTGPLTLTGYNTNATKEPGEPSHAGNIGGRSVWWKWTPTNSGTATIDTRGSYFDTTLAVYTGSSLDKLVSVASSDDVQDGVIQASTVSINVVGGTTYLIAVDGFNGIVNDTTDKSGADNGGIKLNFTYTAVSGSPPSILTQPLPATVSPGGSVTFSVSASGSDPLSYQWLFNGAAISGATGSSYTISNVQTSDGGTYAVTVTNPAGSATSNNVSLTVRSSTPSTPSTPSGGGGGGGGAPSLWFVAVLAALGLGRLLDRRSA